MVLRQDQADRGGEEVASAAKRARSLPDQRFGVAPQRLLALSQGRRHCQTLSDQVANVCNTDRDEKLVFFGKYSDSFMLLRY